MKLKYQAALLTAALALASCSSDEIYGSDSESKGKVYKPGVEVNNVENVIKDGAGTSRATYDISNYIVEFYREGETSPCDTYVYRQMPGVVELLEGNYSVSVRSHNVEKAEWSRPYFTGKSATFTVTAGEPTEVAPIKCTFASLKVTINFGDKLRAAMADDVKVTVVANDEGKLVYTPAEARAGFFEALNGSVTLAATFSGTINGHYEEFTKTYADVAAGQHRIITYELGATPPTPDKPQGSVGNDGISIDMEYVDEDLTGAVDPGKEEVLPGEEEPGGLPEITDPEDPDKPNIPDVPVPPSEPVEFAGTLENGKTYWTGSFSEADPKKQAVVEVKVEKGIKDMVVKIYSTDGLTPDALSEVGLRDEFSLVNDSDLFDKLSGLGLPSDKEVANQTALSINITKFMGLLELLGDNSAEFTMTVTDNDGVVKALKFTLTTIQ